MLIRRGMVYRRRSESDSWHDRPACPHWPVDGIYEETRNPVLGEICPICKSLYVQNVAEEVRRRTDSRP